MDKNKKLPIIELSVVIQGEGRDTGMPSLLIRFTGCNMNCQFGDGICDSANTSWLPTKGKFSLNDIENFIDNNPLINYAFITGGNPSLHPMVLNEVAKLLKQKEKYVAIEDNGTLFFPIKYVDFVTLSPKLENSIPVPGTIINDDVYGIHKVVTVRDKEKHEKYRTNYESMHNWIFNHDYQLKFVVTDEEQLLEIKWLLLKIGANKDKVYLMPEGATRKQLESRRKMVYELALKHGYKYTDRLHILVYNNKTGV